MLFYKKGYHAGKSDILKSKPPAPNNIFTLYEYGAPKFTLGMPGSRGHFTRTSQDNPDTKGVVTHSDNYTNIDNLNRCVASNLSTTDVWRNYFYNGSIWVDTDGLSKKEIAQKLVDLGGQTVNNTNGIANVAPGSSTRGSVAASNITMETTFQFKNSDDLSLKHVPVENMRNCFTCHGTDTTITVSTTDYPSTSPLNFSHIFRRHLSKTAGVAEEKIEELRRADLLMVQ